MLGRAPERLLEQLEFQNRFPGFFALSQALMQLVHPADDAVFGLFKQAENMFAGSASKIKWQAKAMASGILRSCRSKRDTIDSSR